MSFLLSEYENLLKSIITIKNCQIFTVSKAFQMLERDEIKSPLIILRHDVDRQIANSVDMAKLENKLGVNSTYYFRSDKNGNFPQAAIEKISSYGHEIGFHYESLSRTSGNKGLALESFGLDLFELRKIVDCRTVAMHGAPLSKHDNRKLLTVELLSEFNLQTDAVHSFSDRKLYFFTDTGGRWNSISKYNFRDKVGISPGTEILPNASCFSAWLSKTSHPVYISTHPERWSRTRIGYIKKLIEDKMVNLIKAFIFTIRKIV